jgi:hypothetical protein
MLVIRSPHKWWIAAVSALAIMMSWGNHLPGLNYWIFDNVPFMNVFRTPSMVLVIPQLLFPVIAVWGMQDVLSNYSSAEARKDLWKKVKIAAGITGGLALLLGLGGSMFFDFTNHAKDGDLLKRLQDAARAGSPLDPNAIIAGIKEARIAMARNSGLLSAFYIALAAGLLWAFLKDKIKPTFLMAGLALVIAIDLIPTAARYLGEKNYTDSEQYSDNFKPRPVDQQVMQMGQGDPYYRVLDVTKDVYNDATQAFFHKCVGGYSPAKLGIYQDLIDVHMSSSFNAQVLNMLNTRFMIVGQPGQEQVLPNPAACGNAWFVPNVKTVTTADEEILAMKATKLGDTVAAQPGDFNPRETAIVRNSFAGNLQGLQPGIDSGASVKLSKYGLNDIHYVSNNSREGLAVFSDIWYPYGWKAYVDGKETPIIRANYVLRALRLPAGNHKIDFVFHPQKFYTGNTIAGISSILLYILLIGALVVGFRSRKSLDGDEDIEIAEQKKQ